MMLRSLRKRASLTQADLAVAIGRSQTYVSLLEQDRPVNVTLGTLNSLAFALGLSPFERAELILHFADRQGAAVAPEGPTSGPAQMLPALVAGEEAA
jgi:transcriptional regulator with XRE-family HTH domain